MSHRVEIGSALLLAVALTVAYLAGRRQRGAVAVWEPVSTYRTGPTGGRGAYDVLARLGVPVERRRTPLFDLARQARRRPALLAVVSPEQWLAPAEREAVARYVDSGGALVAVGDAGGLTRCFGWDTAEPDSADRDGHGDSASVVMLRGPLPSAAHRLGAAPVRRGQPRGTHQAHGRAAKERTARPALE